MDAQSLIDTEGKKIVNKSIRLETRNAEADYYKTLKAEAKRIKKKEQKGFFKSKQKQGLRLKKAPRATLVIKQYEQEPYRSIYFKREYDKEKRNFFFK